VLEQHAWQEESEGHGYDDRKMLEQCPHGKSAWKFRIPRRATDARGAIHGDRTDGQAFAFGQTSVALRGPVS
jgi:hypothetical protein